MNPTQLQKYSSASFWIYLLTLEKRISHKRKHRFPTKISLKNAVSMTK